jgi:glycine betaine/proline transport system permease protein
MPDVSETFDELVDQGLAWLSDNAYAVFDAIAHVLDCIFAGINSALTLPPFWVIILVTALLGWVALGRAFAVFAVLGLALCFAMNLWAETMSTLALVLSSTILALLFAIPLGILVGLSARASRWSDMLLDFIQTMPPYIFLVPGIALLGYGSATAMCATAVVAIPPALRLTAHGIRMTPHQFRELGAATGMHPIEALRKIRLPFALPSILAGVNQSLMLGFGMVVIAGIAGSGGLGQSVYEAVRTLQIDKSINAGIAIVVLTIVLDRLSQRLGRLGSKVL